MTEIQRRNKLLVDALRSGEYEQGRGQLRYKDRFCCLGVACDVFKKETGSGWWKDSGTFIPNPDNLSGISTLAPHEVGKWFGWNMPNDPDFEEGFASEINDEGNDFEYIAGLFERDYVLTEKET